MSQSDVAIARAYIEAYNARDSEAVDRLLDPDAKITTIRSRAGLPGEWRQGTTREYFEQLAEAWTDFHIEIEEYREVGECIVALGAARGAGMSSRIDVGSDFAIVFVVRNSRIVLVDNYEDWTAALEAAAVRSER